MKRLICWYKSMHNFDYVQFYSNAAPFKSWISLRCARCGCVVIGLIPDGQAYIAKGFP